MGQVKCIEPSLRVRSQSTDRGFLGTVFLELKLEDSVVGTNTGIQTGVDVIAPSVSHPVRIVLTENLRLQVERAPVVLDQEVRSLCRTGDLRMAGHLESECPESAEEQQLPICARELNVPFDLRKRAANSARSSGL